MGLYIGKGSIFFFFMLISLYFSTTNWSVFHSCTILKSFQSIWFDLFVLNILVTCSMTLILTIEYSFIIWCFTIQCPLWVQLYLLYNHERKYSIEQSICWLSPNRHQTHNRLEMQCYNMFIWLLNKKIVLEWTCLLWLKWYLGHKHSFLH